MNRSNLKTLNSKELLKLLAEILKELDMRMSDWLILYHVKEILDDIGVKEDKLW